MIMKKRKVIASLVAVSMATTLLGTMQPSVTQAATKLKVSVSKCTLQVGKTKTVSANKKVTWKSSNKKVATVKKINGKKAKITAKKKGTCKITASVGKKKSVIKITVKKAQKKSTATPTITPIITPDITTNGAIATNSSVTEVYMNEVCGVSISISDIKTTSGTLVIKNNSGTDISFGLNYSIHKYENGQWTVLAGNWGAIPAIAEMVPNGKSSTNILKWADVYGSLPQGTYRVVKEISVYGHGNKKIASQFEITANTEVGVTSAPATETPTGGITASPAVATISPASSETSSEAAEMPTIDIAPQTASPEYANSPVNTLTPEEKEKLDEAIPNLSMPTVTGQPSSPLETAEPDTQIYMNETCGVSVSLSDVKTTNGTLTITNNSGNVVSFGYHFSIEKYEDGQWTVLTENPVVIPAVAIGILDGKIYENNLSWANAYGSLPQGTYRLVKEIFTSEQGKKIIACQFVIDENTEIGATSAPAATTPTGESTASPVVVTAAPAVTPAVTYGINE